MIRGLFCLCAFFISITATCQNEVRVQPEIILERKAYKIFFKKDDSSDSLIISDDISNVEECIAQRHQDTLVIIYVNNGANNITSGRTVTFAKYLLENGRFLLKEESLLYNGSDRNLRAYRYSFLTDRIVFSCKTDSKTTFTYDNFFKFSSMKELRDRISDDLYKGKCENRL